MCHDAVGENFVCLHQEPFGEGFITLDDRIGDMDEGGGVLENFAALPDSKGIGGVFANKGFESLRVLWTPDEFGQVSMRVLVHGE